jgi:hypothetical protein
MQATHVSRSRIARQMTSKERCVGQKSRRAREMQALGSRRFLLHTGHATEPSERWLPCSDLQRRDIHEKRRMRQTHTCSGTDGADEPVKRPLDHVFE